MFNNPQTSGLMNIASQQITPNPMGSRSGVDILSIQNDLKNMSDEQLGLAMQSGTPTYLVASEKNRRVNMRKDFEARKSAQEGTVVQDLFKNQQPLAMGRMQQSFQPKQQGLGSLPGSSEQPVMQMAEGGLIDLIKQQEAYQSTMYDDVGNQAIGYGYNLSPQEIEQGFVTLPDGTQVPLEGGITEKDASSLLEERLGDNFRAGSNILKEEGVDVDSLSPNVRNALQDLTYQTGGGIFNKSPRLVEALRRNDEQAIAEELRTTGRLVNGEILPSTEQRANTRADMVADGSGSVFDTLSNLAGNLSPISTAEAQTMVNTPVFNNPLGMSTIPASTEKMSVLDDGQTVRPSSGSVSYLDTLKQRVNQIQRRIDTANENKRKDDAGETTYSQRNPMFGFLSNRRFDDDVPQLNKELEEAKLRVNKERAKEEINFLRNLQLSPAEYKEKLQEINERYGIVEDKDVSDKDVSDEEKIAEDKVQQEQLQNFLNKEVDSEVEETSNDNSSARQLAFLEAALRVGSSDSPTLQGALGEAVPAIESYRDELDNISQRKYRDAQAKYYGSGASQIQQYNSLLKEVKANMENMSYLPTVDSTINFLKNIGQPDNQYVLEAERKIQNLPEGDSLELQGTLRAIVQNTLIQIIGEKRGIDIGPGFAPPNNVSTQADTINNLPPP